MGIVTNPFPSSSGAAAHHRPRTRWARTLAIALSFAAVVLASPVVDELPEPTAVADLQLAALDGAPQPTPTSDPIPAAAAVEETGQEDEEEEAEAEVLLIDTRIRIKNEGVWTVLHPEEHELRRRATVTSTFEIPVSTKSSTTLKTSATSDASSSKSESSTKTSGSSTSTSTSSATVSSSPLPSFFDGGLPSSYVSSSCPTFIENMIAADEFQACYPISLLLQGSNSFFEAEESLVSISTVLDHACAANVTTCAPYLADVAANLTKSENCGDDYDDGTSTVVDAYLGLIAYQVVYSATCLKNDDTSAYCFGDAVTNSTDPSETYFYFLPLNATLPGSTVPTCGTCLQDTMSIYHVATANRKQPIANTYASAAQNVDVICGPTFANTTLAEAMTTSGAFSALHRGPTSPWFLAVPIFAVVAMSWLI